MIGQTYSPDRIIYGLAVLPHLWRRAICRARGCRPEVARKACGRCGLYDEERLRMAGAHLRFDRKPRIRASTVRALEQISKVSRELARSGSRATDATERLSAAMERAREAARRR